MHWEAVLPKVACPHQSVSGRKTGQGSTQQLPAVLSSLCVRTCGYFCILQPSLALLALLAQVVRLVLGWDASN